MRIYNGTDYLVDLPYVGNQRISIGAHSVSGDLGANSSMLSTLVSAYSTDEMAIIVSGPFELNLCSSIPTVTNYVVQTLEEAIERFSPKVEEVTESMPAMDCCQKSAGICDDACCCGAIMESCDRQVENVEQKISGKHVNDKVDTTDSLRDLMSPSDEECDCEDECCICESNPSVEKLQKVTRFVKKSK